MRESVFSMIEAHSWRSLISNQVNGTRSHRVSSAMMKGAAPLVAGRADHDTQAVIAHERPTARFAACLALTLKALGRRPLEPEELRRRGRFLEHNEWGSCRRPSPRSEKKRARCRAQVPRIPLKRSTRMSWSNSSLPAARIAVRNASASRSPPSCVALRIWMLNWLKTTVISVAQKITTSGRGT